MSNVPNTVSSGQSPDGNGAAQRIAAAAAAGDKIMVRVEGAGAAYIGGSNVSATSGIRMVTADGPVTIPIQNASALFFNAPAGTRVNWMVLGA